MAQNFLYKWEFAVDDLLITRPNVCAPEEYPTCCEISFRSHVFVSICENEFGEYFDTAGKIGKCCLFSLESPIKNTDRLHLNVFKKRKDKCKFLLGTTEIPVYDMFEKVTNDFYAKNPNWDGHLSDPNINETGSSLKKEKYSRVLDNDCGVDKSNSRKEELCTTYELNKKLLVLSNIRDGIITGNVVLIMRLTCMGPTIVLPFPIESQITPPVCPKLSVPYRKDDIADAVVCKRYFNSNARISCLCEECEDKYERSRTKSPNNGTNEHVNRVQECPCPDCEDECEIVNSNDDQDQRSNIKQCILCPTKPEYGPEKYDEFEANFNGSGLTIRVLKDSYLIEDVRDVEVDDLPSETNSFGNIYNDLHQNRFGGKMNKNKSLPIVRENIKYSENGTCCLDNIDIPLFNTLPPSNAVNVYRRMPTDIRTRSNDIDTTLQGINATAKKKGIEICYKTCDDPNTDVFLVRLGKKNNSHNKKNSIEIELRTPKETTNIYAQKWSKETQVDEAALDANFNAKKVKGKKGKKGKKM